ncbi:MAG: LuxR C-terminal-related transcriptional regulator, partial [Luteococcus japonicus]
SLLGGPNPLTDREREVLRLARDGDSVARIAQQVHLSPGTVRNHLSSAIGKTGTENRVEAARVATDNGWI